LHSENINTILSVRNVSKEWPGVLALDNVSLDFEEGEIHALTGENGAGKSTLIKIVAGSIIPSTGKIIFGGKEYTRFDPKQAIDLGIGIIYQEFSLVKGLNVAENIFLGTKLQKGMFVDFHEMYKKAGTLISELGIDLDPKAMVSDLTTAYQQVVEILRAISRNAKVIIMDEPTATLTSTEVRKFFELIKRLKAGGVTIIYISHRMEEIFEISDRISVLRDGKLIATKKANEINEAELVRLMVGRELTNMYPERNNNQSERDNLSVKDLEVKGVLKEINLSVKNGEILGIGGLVGSGRTEMARCIFAADKISKGSIIKDGQVLKLKSPADAIKEKIAYIPEDRKLSGLFMNMTVANNISQSVLKHLCGILFIKKNEERKVVLKYIKELRIKTPSPEQMIINLSGGNQQKVVVAKLLATESDVIIFDEPTRGIDVGAKNEIYNVMNGIVNQGKSIIMITSDMMELLGMSDRIIVMHNGRIAGELSKEEANEEKIISLASGLS
jgi:ABC-type sugar transport system ATPase subunit